MRIERNGDRLFIEVPPKGENERTEVFSKLSNVLFAGWKDENTVIYDTTTFSIKTTAWQLRMIKEIAKSKGYSISDEASLLFAKIARKYEEEKEIERMVEEQRRTRETAISKLKTGCKFCGLLKWDGKRYVCGANDIPCATDPEEAERNFEEWKITKVYSRLTPFPNNQCQYLEVLK